MVLRWVRRIFFLLPVLAAFAFIAVLATFEINDPDTFMYLASGRYIAQNGLIQGCIFTENLSKCPIAYSEWLLFLVTWSVYRAGSWNGLVVFQASISIFTFFFAYLSSRTRGIRAVSVGLVFFLTGLVASERFMLRADTAGVMLLSVCILVLFHLKDQGFFPKQPKKRWAYLFILTVNQLLWANIHGSFPYAWVVVGAAASPTLLRYLLTRVRVKPVRADTLWQMRQLGVVVTVVCLASMVNPYGKDAFLWPLYNVTDSASKELVRSISEYQSPFAHQVIPRWTLTAYQFLTYATALLLLANLKRLRLQDVLLLFPFFYLSTQAVRYIASFGVVAAFVLPYYADGVLSWIAKKTGVALLHIGLIVCIIALYARYTKKVVTNDLYLSDGAARRFGLGVTRFQYPEKGAQFILAHQPPGKIFNSYDWGGYLNFALYPQYKTFMHGSVLDFQNIPSVWLYRYFRQVNLGEVNYQEAADTYGLNIFFLNHTNPIAERLITSLSRDTAHWTLVYLDFMAMIFVRNIPENAEFISTYRFDIKTAPIDTLVDQFYVTSPMDRASAWNQLGILFVNMNLPVQAQTSYEHALENLPHNYAIKKNLGILFKNQGKLDEAIRMFQSSLASEKRDETVYFVLGEAYLQKGNFLRARETFLQAIEGRPDYPDAYQRLGAIALAQGNKKEAQRYLQLEMKYNQKLQLSDFEKQLYGLDH